MANTMLATEAVKPYITAGKAVFTLVSGKTGARYTYRVKRAKNAQTPLWFVQLLTGPSNTSDYSYLGVVTSQLAFRLTGKSKMTAESLPVRAFSWFMARMAGGGSFDGVEVYHAGRCGRCGRMLTVPESVTIGLGPECAGKA